MNVVLDLLANINSFGDVAPLRVVNREWRDVVDNSVLACCVRSVLNDIQELVKAIKTRTHRISESTRDSSEIEQLRFTWTTMTEIQDIIAKHTSCNKGFMRLLCLRKLAKQLSETNLILINRDGDNPIKLTENFGVMELGLRRRMLELAQTGVDNIGSNKAREMWRANFGNRTAVSWLTFRTRMCASVGERCTKQAQAFLCFPGGDMVSSYSYHLITSLYVFVSVLYLLEASPPFFFRF